jgi:hypothetical protein
MLAVPYLLLSFLAGLAIVQRYFRELPALVRIVGAFVVSIVLSSWVSFLAAWLIHAFGVDDATLYGAFVAMLVNEIIIAVGWRQLRWLAPAAVGLIASAATGTPWHGCRPGAVLLDHDAAPVR